MYWMQKKDGPVLKWTLCRSERRNALGDQVYEELDTALRELEKHSSSWLKNPRKHKVPAHVLIIETQVQSSKPIWISGGDLQEHAAKNAQEGRDYAKKYSRICEPWRRTIPRRSGTSFTR